MNVRVVALPLVLLIALQSLPMFGWGKSSTTTQVEGLFKKFGTQLSKIFETAAKEEACANKASGLLGNLDFAARSVFKGVASAGATMLKHPSLTLCAAGIVLYYSPRLRGYTSRGIQSCYGAFSRRYPASMLVRTVSTFAEVWRGINPEAVRVAAAAEEVRGRDLAAREAVAQLVREEQAGALDGLRERIATLETNNLNLQRQLNVEADRKTVFDQLGAQVPELIQRVGRIDAEFGRHFNSDKDQSGILQNIATIAKTMEVHTQQFASFSDLLNQRLNAHKTDTETFVNGSLRAHAEQVGHQLAEHDKIVAQRFAGTQELLAQFAALKAVHETTQRQVIGLHAAIMDRVGQKPGLLNPMEDVE